MSYRVTLSDEAENDLRVGRDFYESCEPNAGLHFLDQMEIEVRLLQNLFGTPRKVRGFHLVRATRFPFGLYFLESSESIKVAAILDLRQSPTRIDQILKSRST